MKLLLWNIIYFSGIETLNIIQKEINNSTIPYIIGAPSSFVLWIIVSSMVPTLMFLLAMIFYFLGLLILSNFNQQASFYIIQILFCIPFSISVNILISSLTLLFKKTFNVINISFDIIYIFVGIYYSINQFHGPLEWVSKVIPLSYVFNEFVFNNYDNIYIFLLEIIMLLLGSFFIFRYIERVVRKNGSIYKY